MAKLDIVIVTYNRLEKLKKTLSHYHNQSASFRSLIVVNNHSTDGTDSFLDEWKKIDTCCYDKYVITMNDNKGGAGGFYEGQKFAMSLNPDWIFVADDDAYADANLVQVFLEYIKSNENAQSLSAICTAVYNNDGTIANEHRSIYHLKHGFKFIRTDSVDEDYENNDFEIDLLSYVGSFLNANKIKMVGCCNPNLFIYFDDTEHSIRLKKVGKIKCVPKMRMVHDCGKLKANKSIDWRSYYSTRNFLFMLRTYFPLAFIYSFMIQLCDLMFLFLKKKYSYKEAKIIFRAIIDSTKDLRNNL